MSDDSGGQIELKRILSASLSQECKRIVQGLLDGSIELTVESALEIIRNHIYDPVIKQFLTDLTLRFEEEPTLHIRGDAGRVVAVPIGIAQSAFYRRELAKHCVLQSTYQWTAIFRDSVAHAAAASINKQPEHSGRRRTSLEDLVRKRRT